MTRTKEQIEAEIKKLQDELAALTPKFAPETLVRFRDYRQPDDASMDKTGKVVKHGRKWIEIQVEGQKGTSWAKTDPLGAEAISEGKEPQTEPSPAQNASKPQQPPVAEGTQRAKKSKSKPEVVPMQKSA